MRSIKWAVAVVAASGLLGCGSQPSIYRVVVDPVSQNIPSSCYRTGQAPPAGDKSTNIKDQQQWVFWEGLEDKAYLEPGSISYNMGQAARVDIDGDAIEGAKEDDVYTFVTERTETESATEVYTTSATYKIEKLGETLEGSLALSSRCSGTDCGGTPACDVTVRFFGRKIDADQIALYGTGADN